MVRQAKGGLMSTTIYNRAKQEAESALHRLLKEMKDSTSLGEQQRIDPERFFPVEPRRLIELNGWTVSSVAMVGHTTTGEELAAKCNNDEKKIFVLRTLSPEVTRYTLAHELGHALLHTDIPDCNGGQRARVMSMLNASKRKNALQYSETEKEAEIFARELLMPERAVRRKFRELFGTDQLRVGSTVINKFAPKVHRDSQMDLRLVAR